MVDNYNFSIKCAECTDSSGSNIFIDVKIGEFICKSCGLVLDDYVYWKHEIYEK